MCTVGVISVDCGNQFAPYHLFDCLLTIKTNSLLNIYKMKVPVYNSIL